MVSLLHKIVSLPEIYDLAQKIAGNHIAYANIKKELEPLPKSGKALDLGGGTGHMRTLLPNSWDYTCLDTDPKKLKGFHKKFPKGEFLQASATKVPAPADKYDLCILSAVSHHLMDKDLQKTFSEINRVMRPEGKFLFFDALWNPRNCTGRLLWALDRGCFPRSMEELINQIDKWFIRKKVKVFKVFHDYTILLCEKKNL